MMKVQKVVALLFFTFAVLSLANGAPGYATPAFTPVPVRNDLFGINFNWWVNGLFYQQIQWPEKPPGVNTSLPYENTVLTNFLKNIGSTVTRWPGGTTSTFWNVTSNFFVQSQNDICKIMQLNSTYTSKCLTYVQQNNTNIINYPTNYLALSNFGNFMHAQNMQWIYVTNLFITTPEEIINAIDSACAGGNPACPTYLELGNEYYLRAFYPTNLLNNVSLYVAKCEQVYNAVKQYFAPGAITAISDFSGYVSNNPLNWDVTWNWGLQNKQNIAYDHLTVHTYSLRASNFQDAKNPEWSWYTLMLAWPETNIRVTANKHLELFPGVDLWLTEFNYGAALDSSTSKDPATLFAQGQRFQPSHGLNIASFYLTMLAYPQIFTKALIFESLRDNYLSCFNTTQTGYFVYAPGQIYAHLAVIMASHKNYTYLTMNNVDLIPKGLNWYNSYSGNMSALQGAGFLADDKMTYVIINRVNYSINIDLTILPSFTRLSTWWYNGTAEISNATDVEVQFGFKFDPTIPAPYKGPMPVVEGSSTVSGTTYTATLLQFSMHVFEFANPSSTTGTTGSSSNATATSTSGSTTGTTSGTGATTSSSSGSGSTTTTSGSGSTGSTGSGSTTTTSGSGSTTTSGSGSTTTGASTTGSSSTTSAASGVIASTLCLCFCAFALFF